MATAGGDETARRTPVPRLLTIASAALLASLVATHGAAAQDYPTKDVRMIVPWGAGGGTDGSVRKVSTLAEKELGGNIYVENIAGGVSATGVLQAMKDRKSVVSGKSTSVRVDIGGLRIYKKQISVAHT